MGPGAICAGRLLSKFKQFFASQKNMFRFEIILCVGFHLYGFGLFVVHMEPAEQLS